MVKNLNEMNKEDLKILLGWYITSEIMKKYPGSLFSISDLKEKVTDYDDLYIKLVNSDKDYVDISSMAGFHFLDEIIYNLYGVYQTTKIKTNLDNLSLYFNNREDIEKILEETEREINKFKTTYEKYLFNFEFLTSRTRNLQKEFLEEKLQEYIKKEQYELCIDIKNKLKNL